MVAFLNYGNESAACSRNEFHQSSERNVLEPGIRKCYQWSFSRACRKLAFPNSKTKPSRDGDIVSVRLNPTEFILFHILVCALNSISVKHLLLKCKEMVFHVTLS